MIDVCRNYRTAGSNLLTHHFRSEVFSRSPDVFTGGHISHLVGNDSPAGQGQLGKAFGALAGNLG